MKKKAVGTLLIASLGFSLVLYAFATDGNGTTSPSLATNDTETMCITSMEAYYGITRDQAEQDILLIGENLPDKAFGGMYRGENGSLIVNVVGDVPIKLSAAAENLSVEYRQVKYALSDLETLAEELIPYMSQFGIFLLDANDATNQLDIGLSDYSDANIAQITALIRSLYHDTDMLNFLDYSNAKISYDVKKEGFSVEDFSYLTDKSNPYISE